MKKSSKVISLVLAGVMTTSCAAGFSAVTASAADGETRVYFEVPTLEEWGTTKQVFCHVYNVYGGTPLTETSWQSKSELCKKDSATGLYYFDTSKVGTIEEGADYALLFSTKDTAGGAHQTGNISFGVECLGDTVYLTGGMVENTEDSSKMDYEGAWKNNSDKYGAMAAITSTGKVVGKYFPAHQPKEQIVARFLCSWGVINEALLTPETVQNVCAQLEVAPMDVYNQYATDYATQLADPEANPNVASLEMVAYYLGVDPNPTTEPETTEPATEPATTEPATTEPATTVPVPVAYYGDVDGDGDITISDATLIQKAGLGFDVAVDATIADVNGDGRVSIADVTLIQKYLVNAGYNTYLVGQPIYADVTQTPVEDSTVTGDC
ncbi:MAG: dockerin type I repeat-containing protein [Ruminococcus sp.]|nr:dockerin type I repeat-containing protein [Ruminococcus sp.]